MPFPINHLTLILKKALIRFSYFLIPWWDSKSGCLLFTWTRWPLRPVARALHTYHYVLVVVLPEVKNLGNGITDLRYRKMLYLYLRNRNLGYMTSVAVASTSLPCPSTPTGSASSAGNGRVKVRPSHSGLVRGANFKQQNCSWMPVQTRNLLGKVTKMLQRNPLLRATYFKKCFKFFYSEILHT
jgi:hypothetical protein